jgi:tRNA A37 threonylcarbamoyltransferase TsaD
MSNYQISNKDIDAVVRYFEIFHPERASREYAQQLLEYIQSALHDIAINNPDDIEAMYQQFEKSVINDDNSSLKN